MTKNIIIVGGGISGLALLHYLKQKHIDRDNIEIVLLEKNDHLGGTIRSIVKEGCLFETGPNGFLDSKKRTLEFVHELDLDDCLLQASQESKIRYLSIDNALHPLPSNPKSFLSFKPLKWNEKLRVLGEYFIPKGGNSQESVYDFGKRRLGERFSQVFLDPMVSGVYGGNAQQMNLKAVFPKIYALEEEHGSLFKAMIKIRKARKFEGNGKPSENSQMGAPAGRLTSFRKGVEQMIERIGQRYQENVHLGQEIKSISRRDNQYILRSASDKQYMADEIFFCAPAYSVSPMIDGVSRQLSQELAKIHYAPIAVVGLVYPMEYFPEKPKGYGYLIPSCEQKQVLGVLFESNIFPGRCPDNQMLFRIMIGGARHPDILNKTKEELISLAKTEIETLVGHRVDSCNNSSPKELFYIPWAKAIPQYDLAYCEIKKTVEDELAKNPSLHLVANYLNGISLNDCIESAYQSAQKSSLQ